MTEIYISYIQKHPIVSAAVFITAVPIFLILIRKAYVDPIFLLLLIYLIIKFALDLTMLHYATNKMNNIVFENTHVVVRYCILSSMFYFKFETKLFRRGVLISILAFLLFASWDFLRVNPSFSNFHQHKAFLYSSTIECILMILWILRYFYETIRSLKIPNLLSYPFFWVSSGMLLYYSSIVFIAPVFHYTFKWNNGFNIGLLVYIPSIFEIVTMVFMSVGIWFYSSKGYARQ
jgi:hypothetical protein